MVTNSSIAELARDFVREQEGEWTREDFEAFLERIKGAGFSVTPEFVITLTSLLESMRNMFYGVGTENVSEFEKVTGIAIDFVRKHQGLWYDPDWQAFLSSIKKDQIPLSATLTKQLGSLLKSLGVFYRKSQPENFAKLMRMAMDFVEHHKGTWDENHWQAFLIALQKQEFEITEEMREYIGNILESIQTLYLKTVEGRLENLVKLAGQFVEAQKGQWGETEWTRFLEDLQKSGIRLSDETTDYLASVTKSMRALYNAATGTDELQARVSQIAVLGIHFMTDNKLSWGDQEWREFLADVSKSGIGVSSEMIVYVGELLENSKAAYRAQMQVPFASIFSGAHYPPL
jgi:hypothetical protein